MNQTLNYNKQFQNCSCWVLWDILDGFHTQEMDCRIGFPGGPCEKSFCPTEGGQWDGEKNHFQNVPKEVCVGDSRLTCHICMSKSSSEFW